MLGASRVAVCGSQGTCGCAAAGEEEAAGILDPVGFNVLFQQESHVYLCWHYWYAWVVRSGLPESFAGWVSAS